MSHFAGRKHTPEARAKQSAAHRGKTLTEEHRRRIGEAIRRANAEGRAARAHLSQMTSTELADYTILTKGRHFKRAQALRLIGRPDLIAIHTGWRKFLSEEEIAECRELRARHGLGMAEALKALGRADLLAEAKARVSAPGGQSKSC